jgi:hypothetical protein
MKNLKPEHEMMFRRADAKRIETLSQGGDMITTTQSPSSPYARLESIVRDGKDIYRATLRRTVA